MATDLFDRLDAASSPYTPDTDPFALLEKASTVLAPPPSIQDVYRERLVRTQQVGRHIQQLRDAAQALPDDSEQRAQFTAEADTLFSALDEDRQEFFNRRQEDIFLESTPISRTPLAQLGFGGREFVEGQLGLGATAASMFYRAIGANNQADAVNRGMQALRQYNDIAARQDFGRPGQVFSHVLKGLSEFGVVGKAGAAAKLAPKELGKLLAGYSAVNTVNTSLTEGSDRGLTGKDLAGFALANGAMDYLLNKTANEAALALGGGLGEVISPVVASQASKLTFGKIARDHVVTAALEALPNAAQSLVNDGLRLTYEVDPNLSAESVLDNALLQATVGAATGTVTSNIRYAGAAVENYKSVLNGWTSRLRRNANLRDRVQNPPESIKVIRTDKEPRTVDVKSSAYGPAYQIKKLAVSELRRLPADSPRRVGVQAHLRDAEATLSNVRRTPEGRKAATDYLEQDLADVDDRLTKNEIDFIALAELENELLMRPAIPPELQKRRQQAQESIRTLEAEQSSLSGIVRKRAGTVAHPPEVQNAKARLDVIGPALEESRQSLIEAEEMIRIYEGDIAAANATTRSELDAELRRLSAERERVMSEKDIIQDELNKLTEVDSPVLKDIQPPKNDPPVSKVVEDSGDFELEALRQRSLNELRDEFGYDKLTTPDRITMDQALQSAVAKGIPDRAVEISTGFLATRQPMSMEEVVGVGVRVKNQGVRYAELVKATQIPTIDAASRDALDAEMQNIESEISLMTEALYHTGTDTARALAARTRKHWASLWGPRFKNRLRQSKGSDLTPEEAKAVDDMVNRINRLDTEIIQLDPKSPMYVSKTYDRQQLANDLMALKSRIEWNYLTKGQRGKRALTEGLNLWRAILTSGDGVPIFRQGVAMLNHPVISAKAMPLFYRGFLSDRNAHQFDLESRFGRRNSDLYGDRFFSDIGDPLSAREEALASAMAERLPWLRNFARGYRAWVNRLRADTFDAIVESNGGRENLTDDQLQTVRELVLNGTGRGGLGGFEQSSRTLYQALIAPRWLTSRFATTLNVPFWKGMARGDAKSMQIAAKEYGKMLLGIGTATYAIEQLGKMFFGEDQVEFVRDPTDPNFGRLRMGSQYVDATGSLAMPIRLLSAAADNLASTVTGSERERDFEQTAIGTFTSRLAPAPSLAANMIRGEVFGQDVTPVVLAKNYAVPWPIGNTFETLQRDGVDQAAASTLLEHFGAGAFYRPPKKRSL